MKFLLGYNMKIIIWLGGLKLYGEMKIWRRKMNFLLVAVDFYHPHSSQKGKLCTLKLEHIT